MAFLNTFRRGVNPGFPNLKNPLPSATNPFGTPGNADDSNMRQTIADTISGARWNRNNAGGGGSGNSFLGTYMDLAKWAVPYAADQNKERLEDKYSLMDEYGLIKGKDAGTSAPGGGLSQLTNDSAKVFASGPSAMPKWGQPAGAATHTPSAYAGEFNQPIDRTEKAPMPTQPYAGTAPGEFTTRMSTGVSTQAPQPIAQPQAAAPQDMSMAEGGQQLPYRYNPLTGEFEDNPDYKEEEVA